MRLILPRQIHLIMPHAPSCLVQIHFTRRPMHLVHPCFFDAPMHPMCAPHAGLVGDIGRPKLERCQLDRNLEPEGCKGIWGMRFGVDTAACHFI